MDAFKNGGGFLSMVREKALSLPLLYLPFFFLSVRKEEEKKFFLGFESRKYEMIKRRVAG